MLELLHKEWMYIENKRNISSDRFKCLEIFLFNVDILKCIIFLYRQFILISTPCQYSIRSCADSTNMLFNCLEIHELNQIVANYLDTYNICHLALTSVYLFQHLSQQYNILRYYTRYKMHLFTQIIRNIESVNSFGMRII